MNSLHQALVVSEPIIPPAGILDQMHNVRLRTVHPFKRERLANLRGAVIETQRDLDSAIQLLHLHLTVEQRRAFLIMAAETKDQSKQVPNPVEQAILNQLGQNGQYLGFLHREIQNVSGKHEQAIQRAVSSAMKCNPITDFLSAFGCNDLSQAVLAESRNWLISAIAKRPSLVKEPNVLGQTPLHLSVAWTEGVRLLLDAGALVDAADNQGLTPVFYAARLGYVDSILVLNEFGCAFHSFETECKGNGDTSLFRAVIMLEEQRIWKVERNIDSLENIPKNATEVANTVVDLVIQRCRILETLARTLLDRNSVHHLQLAPESVLDHKGQLAISMLSERMDVPESLWMLTPPGSTVYHLPSICLGRADSFWKAGFRDVNEFDRFGLTPLMGRDIFGFNHCLNKELEFLDWLILHGADLHRRQGYVWQSIPMSSRYQRALPPQCQGTSSITALHYIAASFGEHYYWELVQESSTLDEVQHEMLALSRKSKRLIQSVFTDPVWKALMMQASVYHVARLKLCRRAALDIAKMFAHLVYVERPNLRWLRSEMFRLITFNSLGLRHTCCKIRKWGSRIIAEYEDEEDRREIRDEQSDLEDILEALLPEFENRWVLDR
ncbi:MAG: hypothetical protein Q9202_002035 [Teloschistes flavicans]